MSPPYGVTAEPASLAVCAVYTVYPAVLTVTDTVFSPHAARIPAIVCGGPAHTFLQILAILPLENLEKRRYALVQYGIRA